jgi:hypothetical protein
MEHFGYDGRTDWWEAICKVRRERQKIFDAKILELKVYCKKNNVKY